MTRAALALLALVAAYMLGRSSRVEPSAPAPYLEPEDDEDAGAYVPMAAWVTDSETYHWGSTLNLTREA